MGNGAEAVDAAVAPSGLRKRLVLCLLLRRGVFANSRNFTLENIGDIDWIIQYLNFEAIDELVVLNVERTCKDTSGFAAELRLLCRYCFVPVVAGGGVRTIGHFEALMDAGADKVALNTAVFEDPAFVADAVDIYGSQSVVASIDCRRVDGVPVAFTNDGTKNTRLDGVTAARRAEALGVGEIFLTSIDRDGTGRGYDLELVQSVSAAVGIPVIASGGVGQFAHLVEGIVRGGASAVSAANIFHFIGEGLIKAKQYVNDAGLDFPLWTFDRRAV